MIVEPERANAVVVSYRAISGTKNLTTYVDIEAATI